MDTRHRLRWVEHENIRLHCCCNVCYLHRLLKVRSLKECQQSGNTVDVERLPFLQTIREQYVGRFLLICLMYSVELRTILPQPIKSINGFPLLDSDCKWPDIPLFMRGLDHPQVWCIANAQVIAVGGYSLLEIGPSAFNLASTRECSERVVHALGNLGIGVSKNSTPADAIVDGGLFDALSGLSESC